jgi:hypothetical protein
MLQQFLALTLDQPDEVVSGFRTLWRGFGEQDLAAAAKELRADRQRYMSRVDGVILATRAALRIACRKSLDHKAILLRANLAELLRIRDLVRSRFKNAGACAYLKCSHETAMRRRKLLDPDMRAGDYLFLEMRLPRLDPAYVEFPLRFAVHLPAGWYRELYERWRTGASKDDVIRPLMPRLFDHKSLAGVVAACRGFDQRMARIESRGSSREAVAEELQPCIAAGSYTAATLLAVTQVEGILWDFATYLNRQNIRVFKTEHGGKKLKYLPYPWDHGRHRYSLLSVQTRRPRHDPKFRLNSARQMLERTRLGEYFNEELYDYLIDDFYDERNDLVHRVPRASEETAARAILCLRAVMGAAGRVIDDREKTLA